MKSILSLLMGSLLLVGCAGAPTEYRFGCAEQVSLAWSELDLAKAEGFAGTVSYSKAISLISVAKTMQTVENFDSCYDKANKARFYIAESRQGR